MYYKHLTTRNGKSRRRLFFFSIVGIILAFLFFVGYSHIYNYFFPSNTRFDSIITKISKRYALDPLLVKAVIWRESDFNPNVVGAKGEIGLMQLMIHSSVQDWTNYTKKKITNKGVLFNPKLNIEIGAWYLAHSRDQWINYNNRNILALAGYNAGYSNVKKWIPENYQEDDVIKFIKFPSTKKYVESILKKYKSYQQDAKE